MDLEEIRKLGVLEKALSRLLTDRASYELADQDALNAVLWRMWLQIDARWNFQRGMLYKPNIEKFARSSKMPAIIHFTESQKPWQRSEWHPYGWLYLKYLRATPFYKEVVKAEQITLVDQVKSYIRYLRRRSRS